MNPFLATERLLWSTWTTAVASCPVGHRAPIITCSPSPRTWVILHAPVISIRPRLLTHPGRVCARRATARRIRVASSSSLSSGAMAHSKAVVSGRSASMRVSTIPGPVGSMGSPRHTRSIGSSVMSRTR